MKWLLLLLSVAASQANDIELAWDASITPGEFYRVWMSSNASPPIVIKTTTATSTVLSLNPGVITLFVTAVGPTNESDASNIYRLPPPPSVVAGIAVATNSPPPPPTNQTAFIQAESGALVPPMVVVDVAGAIGQAVLSPTANNGTATFLVSLAGGTYVVWARLIAISTSADSFFVAVDGINEDNFANESVVSPNWQWRKVTGEGGGGVVRTFVLPAGAHAFRFRGREPGVPLDAIYVTSDMSFVPQ